MKITKLTEQVKNPERVNVFVDEKYLFSLDISQIIDLKIKVGREICQQELECLKQASLFGKLYSRSLKYALIRPRSIREMKDYLWRLTQPKLAQNGKKQVTYPSFLAEKVLERLIQKNYVNDQIFAKFWITNRNQRKGISERKLIQELSKKGISREIIRTTLAEGIRDDKSELQKIIVKKSSKYDNQKLFKYLLSKGFNYDDIKEALADLNN